MRGLAAGHERKHDAHVQNAIAVAPVTTCSCFTKAVSRHPGHAGIGETERVVDSRVLPTRAMTISVVRNRIGV